MKCQVWGITSPLLRRPLFNPRGETYHKGTGSAKSCARQPRLFFFYHTPHTPDSFSPRGYALSKKKKNLEMGQEPHTLTRSQKGPESKALLTDTMIKAPHSIRHQLKQAIYSSKCLLHTRQDDIFSWTLKKKEIKIIKGLGLKKCDGCKKMYAHIYTDVHTYTCVHIPFAHISPQVSSFRRSLSLFPSALLCPPLQYLPQGWVDLLSPRQCRQTDTTFQFKWTLDTRAKAKVPGFGRIPGRLQVSVSD